MTDENFKKWEPILIGVGVIFILSLVRLVVAWLAE